MAVRRGRRRRHLDSGAGAGRGYRSRDRTAIRILRTGLCSLNEVPRARGNLRMTVAAAEAELSRGGASRPAAARCVFATRVACTSDELTPTQNQRGQSRRTLRRSTFRRRRRLLPLLLLLPRRPVSQPRIRLAIPILLIRLRLNGSSILTNSILIGVCDCLLVLVLCSLVLNIRHLFTRNDLRF